MPPKMIWEAFFGSSSPLMRNKKETTKRLSLLCVGVTYFPGSSPNKYLRRK